MQQNQFKISSGKWRSFCLGLNMLQWYWWESCGEWFVTLVIYKSAHQSKSWKICLVKNCFSFKEIWWDATAWIRGTLLYTHRDETWCANVHVRASKMEDGKCGAQTRCYFSHFNTDFQLETDVQESSSLKWIHAISNLTGFVLYCWWAAWESWRNPYPEPVVFQW